MSAKLYDKFVSQLELQGYAKRSIDSYLKAVMQLQRFCNKPLYQITGTDLREYWLTCKRDYGWCDATLRISYSGIKHFFSLTLVRKWKVRKWIAPHGDFLVHVRALSAVFKGGFRAELARHGLLRYVPESVWRKKWVVHCKAVGNGRTALKYLGAYVFRVAISNARIIDYDGRKVTFKYFRVGSRRPRKCTLDAMEFIRRYLQHILPAGFMKVRHYGFLHAKCSVTIERIRELINQACKVIRKLTLPRQPEKFKPLLCGKCNSVMEWKKFISPWGKVFCRSS